MGEEGGGGGGGRGRGTVGRGAFYGQCGEEEKGGKGVELVYIYIFFPPSFFYMKSFFFER